MFEFEAGNPGILGATPLEDGVNFAIYSSSAESVSQHPEYLSLFNHAEVEDIAVYTHNHDHHHDLHGHVVAEDGPAEEHRHQGGCHHD